MSLWYHKIDSLRWLDGSIREDLSPEERGVWADLLALAGLTREPRRGYIERSEGIPYTHEVLLTRLNISAELFERTVLKCVKEGRLEVLPDGTMIITNWARYNDTTTFREHRRAKEQAIAKGVETKHRQATATDALIRAVNKLNQGLSTLRYEATGDGRILDKKTGEIRDTIEGEGSMQ